MMGMTRRLKLLMCAAAAGAFVCLVAPMALKETEAEHRAKQIRTGMAIGEVEQILGHRTVVAPGAGDIGLAVDDVETILAQPVYEQGFLEDCHVGGLRVRYPDDSFLIVYYDLE